MKIVSSAPARVSFLGGGSDLDSFSSLYGGACLSMAINLRSQVELMTGDDMWNEYNVFPQSCKPDLCYAIRDAYEVNNMHQSVVKSSFDGIIGAGLGSSGAFSVALASALDKLKGIKFDRYEIAEKAYKVELGVHTTGRQDHYAASYGGFNLFTFGINSQSTPLSKKWVDLIYPYMVLTYTDRTEKVQSDEMTPLKIQALTSMRDLILKAISALSEDDVLEFIQLVDLSWKMKKEFNPKVSNDKIDNLYDKGIVNGALGGKLLGSGGGGYFLFFVEPSKRQEFIENMGIEVTDFMPDYQGVEVRIV